MFLGANTLECESSRERMFPGQFAPGNESSRERIGQGPIGRFAPGSELAIGPGAKRLWIKITIVSSAP